MDIHPFTVNVLQATLDDLQDRLARTCWPDEIPGSGWDYGSNLAYIKELVDYWQTKFDWQAQEKAINAFSHFRANGESFLSRFQLPHEDAIITP